MESDERNNRGFGEVKLLIGACLLTFGCYVASYMRIPVVPLYAKTLGASTKMVGAINSAFFFMAGLLSFPLGLLSDRLGRKVVALGGLSILALTSFVLYFTSRPSEILVTYFFFGLGLAAYGPTMMSFVADISPKTHIGRAYGWYTTFLYVGMSLGPAVGSWVADKTNFDIVFLGSGLLSSFLFFVMLFALPNTRPLSSLSFSGYGGNLEKFYKNRALLACWVITFGGCFALGMFVTFIPLYAKDVSIAMGKIGLIFFAQGVINAISRIPFGWFSDRVSDRRILVLAGIAMTIFSMAGFAKSYTLYHFIGAAILLGAGMAVAFTSIGALITEIVSPSVRGFAMGGYNACIYFGIMISSITMGSVIEKWGYEVAFLDSAGFVLATLVLFFLMFKRPSLSSSQL